MRFVSDLMAVCGFVGLVYMLLVTFQPYLLSPTVTQIEAVTATAAISAAGFSGATYVRNRWPK